MNESLFPFPPKCEKKNLSTFYLLAALIWIFFSVSFPPIFIMVRIFVCLFWFWFFFRRRERREETGRCLPVFVFALLIFCKQVWSLLYTQYSFLFLIFHFVSKHTPAMLKIKTKKFQRRKFQKVNEGRKSAAAATQVRRLWTNEGMSAGSKAS